MPGGCKSDTASNSAWHPRFVVSPVHAVAPRRVPDRLVPGRTRGGPPGAGCRHPDAGGPPSQGDLLLRHGPCFGRCRSSADGAPPRPVLLHTACSCFGPCLDELVWYAVAAAEAPLVGRLAPKCRVGDGDVGAVRRGVERAAEPRPRSRAADVRGLAAGATAAPGSPSGGSSAGPVLQRGTVCTDGVEHLHPDVLGDRHERADLARAR